MNNLITTNNELTMSSREIAELTGKRHDNVLADIRNMLSEIQSPEKLGDYKDGLGRTYPMLLLNKDEALCLVSGYNVKMRMTIIKRWQELESGIKPINLNDPEFLRNVLLSYTEKAIQLEKKIEEKNEKIESLENLFVEGMTVVAFCKQLNGVNTQEVNRFLAIKNWLYRNKKGWRAGSYARDKYLTEKAGHKYVNSNDEEVVTYKQELLRRGAARLHDMYMKGELPMKKDWDGSYHHSKFLFSKEVA